MVHILCEPLIVHALLKTKKDTAAKKRADIKKSMREASSSEGGKGKSGVSMNMAIRAGTGISTQSRTSYSEANAATFARPSSKRGEEVKSKHTTEMTARPSIGGGRGGPGRGRKMSKKEVLFDSQKAIMELPYRKSGTQDAGSATML